MDNNKPIKDCDHKFNSLGFNVYKTTDTSIEAVACIFCESCGLFRTKILTFKREFNENNHTGTTRE